MCKTNSDVTNAKEAIDKLLESLKDLGIPADKSDNTFYYLYRTVKFAELLFSIHPFRIGQTLKVKESVQPVFKKWTGQSLGTFEVTNLDCTNSGDWVVFVRNVQTGETFKEMTYYFEAA